METVERILALAARKGVKQAHLTRAIGGYRGKLTEWKNKKSSPSSEELLIIAAELGTTAAYLRGETDDPRPAADVLVTGESAPVSAEEAERLLCLEEIYHAVQPLDREGLKLVAAFINMYKVQKK